ncbi:MAG TPA: TRAP transporter permease [Burkholderiaceae bacterium]|nr:TRAP transporter permease [Burkholderiaceae bacterium]
MQIGDTDVQQLAKDADLGGRSTAGWIGAVMVALGLVWVAFQLWYASPIPFALGVGVFNDTEARSFHLAIALFLAFLAFPAFRRSPRDRVPVTDWLFAALGAASVLYLIVFYRELALRPGNPTGLDVAVGIVGLLLLLEATRRAVGLPMAVLAVLFLVYVMAGPHLPDVIAHKGASISRVVSHMWMVTEGVFGIALGVSVSFIFVFVLFGTLLDRAGGGNYMMQVSFALLGHLRGGPAKVAVVSSALNGLISGSSVSNVVSGGIFTIPLMKRSGYGGVKAAAIETSSSVNGQIMPPVMGAAAFLMVEYVGIPYSDIIKHAFIPAVISYIALFYIVHIEALKLGLEPTARERERSMRNRLQSWGLGLAGSAVALGVIYYVALGAQAMFGGAAPYILGALLTALYVYSVWVAAKQPDLPVEIDVNNPVLPPTWPTVKAGLHFLIPVGVLIWCLMVEELSPGLSAFWGVTAQILLMATQRPLIALFRRKPGAGGEFVAGLNDVLVGCNDGARNMIGIAIATGCAGIIVGAITLTGLGLRMTDFVEFVSQGNILVMLLFTAFVCLVLGLGVPTTANYILVATLMAPVIVELGAQSGMVIPLIAVHLFVFYYGIMGDITPPVGLASFAGAAIAKVNPIDVGIQGSVYAIRTVVLPFIWIFNPALLLINVHGWFEALLVAAASTVASLLFAAATMNYMRTKCRWWEVLLLLAATFILFRPDWFADRIAPEYTNAPASQFYEVAARLDEGDRLVFVIAGQTLEGEERNKTVALRMGPKVDDANPMVAARKRLAEAGINVSGMGEMLQVTSVRFGSTAAKARIEQGFEIAGVKVPTDRINAHWFYIPGLVLAALIWWLQGLRVRRTAPAAA